MLTEVFLNRFVSSARPDSYFEVGFSLIPPTVISSHLGKLSLLNPMQFLVAVFEVGPIVLALPLTFDWGYKALREEKWIQAALVAAIVPSLLSIFIAYSGNAGITATTRLLSMLFFVCKILAVPLFWLWLQNQPQWKHSLTYGFGIATIFAGLVLFAIELIAIPRPVYTSFLIDMDARFYQKYWNRLAPPSAWILDPNPLRAVTVFGRQANAVSAVSWITNTPEYQDLIENPDPFRLNAMGYHYLYADKEYWKKYDVQLRQPCVKILDTIEGVRQTQSGSAPDFRRLADISQCK
jgi:hypothetical protein